MQYILAERRNPTGEPNARLSAQDGQERRYTVSLEAKSKEDITKTVTARAVDVSCGYSASR